MEKTAIGKSITGQLFLRGPMQDLNGKQVFMVVGVIGIDEAEAMMIEGESQYTIKNIELIDPTIAARERARGMNADNLLRAPIWRI